MGRSIWMPHIYYDMDKKYKLVLFDFFGVICCEISPYWLKARFPAEKAMEIKNRIVGSADNGEISEREMFERLSKATDVPADVILKEWMECAIIDQEVLKIINELKKNYTVGLLSNAPPDFEQRILNRDNLWPLFEKTFISSERMLAKPDPAFFYLALDEMGFKAEETLFVDDNPRNIEAANKLGITGILFTNAEKLREDLKVIAK